MIKDAYIYDLHQLLLHCGEHCFSASLRTVIAPGWKAKSGSSADEEEEEKTDTIQDVRQFDHTNCAITQVVQEQKKTTPPKHYTMASLLAFMEHPKETGKRNLCGLGTPATRAEIIKDLIDRKYISVSAKNIVATDKAVFLSNRLSHMPLVRAFASVSKTTEMEQQLKENPHTFEADVTALLKSALVPLNTQTIERFGASAAGSCPLCGKPIREGKASWYCSGYKTDNCTFTIWKQAFGTQFTAQDVTQLLSGKLTKTKACTSKAGKKFNAQFKLTDAKLEPVFENKKGK